jgi:hypothetical protein
MLDSAKIKREVSRIYDKDPQGWNVLVGRDRAGFYDILFSHGTKAWQIKEYQVNPYKFVGLGAKLQNVPEPAWSTPDYPFGLRPISVDLIRELTNSMDDPKAMNEIATKLLSERTVNSRDAAQSPAILQGPVFQSNRPIDALSPAHMKLDERLRKELQRIVHREFRHTVTPYI